MTVRDGSRATAAVAAAERVRALPYRWPSPPDAASARTTGSGSCASKHALLAELLDELGVASVPLLVTGPLVPTFLHDDSELAAGSGLVEVHELLTVLTPWAGPLRVDVTWDPPLVAHGLPGGPWDGRSDTPVAVGESGPGWSVPRGELRAAKEALRRRVYDSEDRAVRDRVLAAMSDRFAQWR